MPAGRPSKYSEEVLEIAKDYVKNYEEYGDPVPTAAGLACALDICKDTVNAWARDEDKKEFSYTLKKLHNEQEKALIRGGISGEFSATIAKLMLHNHDYSEKQDIKQEHSGNVNITTVERKIVK